MLADSGKSSPCVRIIETLPGTSSISASPRVEQNAVINAIRRRAPYWSPRMPNSTEDVTATTEASTSTSEKVPLDKPIFSIAISD